MSSLTQWNWHRDLFSEEIFDLWPHLFFRESSELFFVTLCRWDYSMGIKKKQKNTTMPLLHAKEIIDYFMLFVSSNSTHWSVEWSLFTGTWSIFFPINILGHFGWLICFNWQFSFILLELFFLSIGLCDQFIFACKFTGGSIYTSFNVYCFFYFVFILWVVPSILHLTW